MPTTPKAKKKANSSPPGAKRRRSLNGLLGENRTLKAWLRPGKGSPSEAFVILAEGLSSKDREFLASAADLVVDPGEDLLRRIAALERENRQLKSLSLSDDLTGLYNKRFFSIQLEIEMARSRRTGLPCSLMIIDFDNFKEINDRFGHGVGDQALLAVANLIRASLRPYDSASRWGGDEFLILLPSTDAASLQALGERIRLRVAEADLGVAGNDALRLSVSIGAYYCQPGETLDSLLHMADKALYAAKAAGRDRVCIVSDSLEDAE